MMHRMIDAVDADTDPTSYQSEECENRETDCDYARFDPALRP
jgi:hypothetical protein